MLYIFLGKNKLLAKNICTKMFDNPPSFWIQPAPVHKHCQSHITFISLFVSMLSFLVFVSRFAGCQKFCVFLFCLQFFLVVAGCVWVFCHWPSNSILGETRGPRQAYHPAIKICMGNIWRNICSHESRKTRR